MRTMAYWIQHSDFSAIEFDPVSADDAIRILRQLDWDTELDAMEKQTAAGKETCPPGIGFVASPGNLLHLCTTAPGKLMVHLHRAEQKRFLGLIPYTASLGVQSRENVPVADAEEYVRRFYSGDLVWLTQNIAADGG